MATASHGYEPHRLTTLDLAASSAVTAMQAITSTDPAAWEAMAALRQVQSVIDNGWRPSIRAILSSTALSGRVSISALGGGGSSSSWDTSSDPGTCPFQPFDALSALFPGDDDITGEEIAAKIEEILDADPSPQQVLELGILTNALEEIAMNTQLSADVIEAMGPEGVAELYGRLHDLGYPYPVPETPTHPHLDPDLSGVIEAFGLVVTQGVKRPGAEAVIRQVIETADDWPILRGVAPLAGLARVDNLPPALADQLLEALRRLDDRDLPNDTMLPTNVAYPGLPVRTESLIAVLFGGNPDLVTRHIYGPAGFVDGGEELLGDLIETRVRNDIIGAEVSEALGDVIQRIIDQTPQEALVEIDDLEQTGKGVVFDLVRLLLDHDFKVSGLGVVEAMAPYLPILTGAYPGSTTPFAPDEIGDLYYDLFNDMSAEEVETALAAVLAGTLGRLDDFSAGEFGSGRRADILIGQLLDGVLGPATAAIERAVDDADERAAIWRNAVNQAFGLLSLPGGKVAGFALRKGFEQFVEGTITTKHGALDAAAMIDAIAVQAALVTIYGTDEFHDEIVQNALDDWDATAAGFDTIYTHGDEGPAERAAKARKIAGIKRELEASLEPGSPPLDFELFLDLPEMRDVVLEIYDKVTLSPNGRRSGD